MEFKDNQTGTTSTYKLEKGFKIKVSVANSQSQPHRQSG